MKFNIYITLSAALLWFTFASVFMYRSTWKLDRAHYHKGEIEEFGVKYLNNDEKATLFTFKLQGLNQEMGIYRKKVYDYDTFIRNFQIGQVADLHYENWKQNGKAINLQVVQLETGDKFLVDYKDRKRRDLLIAVILYFICSIFIGAAWILRQKQLRQDRLSEYFHLGMNMYV